VREIGEYLGLHYTTISRVISRYVIMKELTPYRPLIHAELGELSSVERETLEALSQTFGIKVYVRTRKGGELIAVGHG